MLLQNEMTLNQWQKLWAVWGATAPTPNLTRLTKLFSRVEHFFGEIETTGTPGKCINLYQMKRPYSLASSAIVKLWRTAISEKSKARCGMKGENKAFLIICSCASFSISHSKKAEFLPLHSIILVSSGHEGVQSAPIFDLNNGDEQCFQCNITIWYKITGQAQNVVF